MQRDPKVPQVPGTLPGTLAREGAAGAAPLKGGTLRGTLPTAGQLATKVPRQRASARAAARERQAAGLLGTKRVHRSRYESAPDVAPVTLPCGVVLQPEVKTRKRLPALLRGALLQAIDYGPAGCVPAAVMSETGGEPIIAIPLRAFRRIAGLEPGAAPDPQLAISFPDLGPDERRVLDAIAARLRLGAKSYGVLDIGKDRRAWIREASEELLDGCVYLACNALRRST